MILQLDKKIRQLISLISLFMNYFIIYFFYYILYYMFHIIIIIILSIHMHKRSTKELNTVEHTKINSSRKASFKC